QGNTAMTSVTVTVAAAAPPPVADAIIHVNGMSTGASITVADKDSQPGEMITFQGSTSTAGAVITNYAWFIGDASSLAQTGASSQFVTRLPDGASSIHLLVTDAQGKQATTSVNVNVGAAATMNPMASAVIHVNGMPTN